MRWALEAGVRMIDMAEAYQNEDEVGRAIADSGVRLFKGRTVDLF